MSETFPKVNPTPEDEKKMDKVLYRAKEILANAVADDMEKEKNGFSEFNSVSENKEKTESILNEVKEILARAAEDDEKRKKEQAFEELCSIDDNYEEDLWEEEDKPSKEEIREMEDTLKRITKELKDESSDFYTNVDKGSTDELFFRTLAEEVPSLNLSVSEEAFDKDGHLLKNHIAIKTVPYKTDREFISDLADNDLIHILRHPDFYSEKDIKELEESGEIPKNFYRRALAKQYEFCVKKWPSSADFWKGEIAELGDIIPFSDEEIQEIMRKVILDEFKKRLNGD